jgi:hypothetical protein
MLRLGSLILLLAACATPALVQPDARFETRDAIVDPPDSTTTDVPVPSRDASVDVTLYDTIEIVDTGKPITIDMPFSMDAAVSRDVQASLDRVVVVDLQIPEDVPPSPCADLAEQYALTVREAARCSDSTECSASVCETLCCTCQVFVTMGTIRALNDVRVRAESLGCLTSLRCLAPRCPPPMVGVCSGSGRCVTLRPSPDGG